ncbi:MAG TPA: hypothetical protein VLG11_06030 [Candidatus Saccharimonadales bacterium]|nr:hypothetical protein [Candidatus Saccharimonadales bacterium]
MNVQLEPYNLSRTIDRGWETMRFIRKHEAQIAASYPETAGLYASGLIRGLGAYARQAAEKYPVPDLATGGEEHKALAFGIRSDDRLIGMAHVVPDLRVQGLGSSDHRAVTHGTYVDYFLQPETEELHDTVGELLYDKASVLGRRLTGGPLVVDTGESSTHYFRGYPQESPIMTFARTELGALNPQGIMNYLKPINEPQPYVIQHYGHDYPVRGGVELQLYWKAPDPVVPPF